MSFWGFIISQFVLMNYSSQAMVRIKDGNCQCLSRTVERAGSCLWIPLKFPLNSVMLGPLVGRIRETVFLPLKVEWIFFQFAILLLASIISQWTGPPEMHHTQQNLNRRRHRGSFNNILAHLSLIQVSKLGKNLYINYLLSGKLLWSLYFIHTENYKVVFYAYQRWQHEQLKKRVLVFSIFLQKLSPNTSIHHLHCMD